MAGKRNAEGIALLSVYVDSDNDLDDSPAASPLIPAVDAPGSIVDYAHDEGAGTPEHKEDIDVGTANDEATVDDMQTDEGGLPEQVCASPVAEVGGEPSAASKLEEQAQDDSTLKESINHGGGEARSAEEDVLSGCWPSPPSTPCSNELQAKFAMFLKWKERGRSFNEDLRNSKGYRNPDFLQLAVVHQKIDEIGSCFDAE